MGILFQSVIDQSLPYLEKICSRYTVTDKDVGVVTAADSKFFTGLQLLYTSLKHKVNFCVFDIGLSDHQIKWCKDNDIIVRFNAKDFTIKHMNYISQLPEILANDELEVGSFELDIFEITINKIKTYEEELIECKR